jgi:prepilin-type N-terminal cleavage/methylation domain-containing protein
MNAFRPSPRQQAGFTLVELLVAMLVSLVLAGALVLLQAKLGQQGVRTQDVASRDDQARSAMDLVVQDLSGAGFLFGGTPNYCNALFTYNSASGGGVVASHVVDAVAASSGATVAAVPSLVLNYPPSGIPSDVLLITSSIDAQYFSDSVSFSNPSAPPSPSDPNPPQPLTDGKVPLTQLQGLNSGDTAIVQVPDPDTSSTAVRMACFRVPISSFYGTNSGIQSAAGTTFPGTFYNAFVSTVTSAGFETALSNGLIFQGFVSDIGSVSTSRLIRTVYYVDNSGTFPALVRRTYSLVDDSQISSTTIAAGVISLQVRFGVDVGNTGAVTEYDTAALVTSGKKWDYVRSVKVWIVTRTLADDPSTTNQYTAPATITAPTSFSDITVPTDKTHRRYASQVTEIALRSVWNSNKLTLPYQP